MKNKLLLIAVPFLAMVTSCSYGAIAKVSTEDFNTFYNRGDLAKQKEYDFVLGDDASLAAYGPTDDGVVTISMSLGSSSLAKWESDHVGNALSYKMNHSLEDDGETIQDIALGGSLSYASKNISEENEETGESVLVGRLDSYTYDENNSINRDSENKNHTSHKVFSSYYQVNEETGEFEEDPLYLEYTYSVSNFFKESVVSDDDNERETAEGTQTESYTYRYYSQTRSNWSYALNQDTRITLEEKVQGTFVYKSKVVDIKNQTTVINIGNAPTDKGEEKIEHIVYEFKDGQFVKDPDASSESKDETYRKEFTDEEKASFAADKLLASFKGSASLKTFLATLNLTVQSIFEKFEEYHSDIGIKEEIIRFSDTYQYRARIDDSTIVQYTFVEGAENKDRLTNIVYFEIGSGGSLTETSKITLLY